MPERGFFNQSIDRSPQKGATGGPALLQDCESWMATRTMPTKAVSAVAGIQLMAVMIQILPI
jgi:hypothetical protein